jgi:hypothetical protein
LDWQRQIVKTRDPVTQSGVKDKHKFEAVGSTPVNGANTAYCVAASPLIGGRTGKRRFCSTDTSVIRVAPNAAGSMNLPDAQQCAGFSPWQ